MRDLLLIAAGFIIGISFSIGIAYVISPKQDDLLDIWKEMSE